jgi:hypothetical protein
MPKDKKRQLRAETIMGEGRYAQQVRRARRAKMKGTKASTIDTIKRVGEYKKAYKPPIHGRRKK